MTSEMKDNLLTVPSVDSPPVQLKLKDWSTSIRGRLRRLDVGELDI